MRLPSRHSISRTSTPSTRAGATKGFPSTASDCLQIDAHTGVRPSAHFPGSRPSRRATNAPTSRSKRVCTRSSAASSGGTPSANASSTLCAVVRSHKDSVPAAAQRRVTAPRSNPRSRSCSRRECRRRMRRRRQHTSASAPVSFRSTVSRGARARRKRSRCASYWASDSPASTRLRRSETVWVPRRKRGAHARWSSLRATSALTRFARQAMSRLGVGR